MLEETLDETGGPWILGLNPSLADINLLPYAARLDFLGLLDLWIKERPQVQSWWTAARQWPAFKSGLRDKISEDEISETRLHGPKIANEAAETILSLRHKMAAVMSAWRVRVEGDQAASGGVQCSRGRFASRSINGWAREKASVKPTRVRIDSRLAKHPDRNGRLHTVFNIRCIVPAAPSCRQIQGPSR
jgi:hypothetical protein